MGNKWVFRVKRNIEGKIMKYKAKLVAKGFLQTSCIDYHETFSPVIEASTLRIILALLVLKGWSIRQVVINDVFLNGKLDEEVYMSQLEGFVDKASYLYVQA